MYIKGVVIDIAEDKTEMKFPELPAGERKEIPAEAHEPNRKKKYGDVFKIEERIK